jgi:hypothetical protein
MLAYSLLPDEPLKLISFKASAEMINKVMVPRSRKTKNILFNNILKVLFDDLTKNQIRLGNLNPTQIYHFLNGKPIFFVEYHIQNDDRNKAVYDILYRYGR